MLASGAGLLAAADLTRATAEAPNRRSETLHVLHPFDPDPQHYSDSTFDGLGARPLLAYEYVAGKRGYRLIGDGATGKPNVTPDGKTYTFSLRRRMKFSDGKPITAASYVRAFRRLLAPNVEGYGGQFFAD